MTDEEFRRLFAAHATSIYLYALRRVGPDRADDVVSDTFLVAWRRRADVPADRERPWLLTTARWVMADVQRSAIRQSRLHDRLSTPPHEPDPAVGIAATVDVQRAMAALRPADQEALRLIEWDQLTHAEAAQVLGCGVAAFSVRLRRARARFARALAGAQPEPDSPRRRPPVADIRPAPQEGVTR